MKTLTQKTTQKTALATALVSLSSVAVAHVGHGLTGGVDSVRSFGAAHQDSTSQSKKLFAHDGDQLIWFNAISWYGACRGDASQ